MYPENNHLICYFIYLFIYCLFQVLQAHHGEAETSAHQREPGPAEDPHHGRSQERCKDISNQNNTTHFCSGVLGVQDPNGHIQHWLVTFCPLRAPDTPNWRRRTSWRWQWSTSGACRDSRCPVSLRMDLHSFLGCLTLAGKHVPTGLWDLLPADSCCAPH